MNITNPNSNLTPARDQAVMNARPTGSILKKQRIRTECERGMKEHSLSLITSMPYTSAHSVF